MITYKFEFKNLDKLATTIGSLPVTSKRIKLHSRPHEPVDEPECSTKLSQMPIIEGPDKKIRGTIGLMGFLISTVIFSEAR